jgi:hypothetical protein
MAAAGAYFVFSPAAGPRDDNPIRYFVYKGLGWLFFVLGTFLILGGLLGMLLDS